MLGCTLVFSIYREQLKREQFIYILLNMGLNMQIIEAIKPSSKKIKHISFLFN